MENTSFVKTSRVY